MKSIKQRVAAFLLAVMMTVSGMPIEAFAAETTNSPPEEVESVLRLDNDKNKPLETEDTTIKEQTEPKEAPSTTQDKPAIKEDAPEETEELDVSEDKTSEDMDKQTVGEYTGPAHNSVTSSDGKVQIRNFEVMWASTDEDTIVDTRKIEYFRYDWYKGKSNFEKEPKMQINWALSGEVQYPKGAMSISIPDMQFEDENDLKYPFTSYSIPKAVFKEDGSIDYDADYGNATLAYYYDKDEKVTKLVNILDLAPGASGTFTLTYGNYKGNSRWLKDMSIHESKPTIDLKYNDEVLKTKDRTLKIQQDTKFDAKVYKDGALFKTWQDNWGDKFKPENPEDYWYVCYQLQLRINDAIQTNLDCKLTDTLGDIYEYKNYEDLINSHPQKTIKGEQEIIAYSALGTSQLNYNNPSKNEEYEGNAFTATDFSNKPQSKNKIEWPVENKKLKTNEQKSCYSTYSVNYKYAYVLVKIPAKKLGYMKKDQNHYIKAYNDAKLEVVPKNSDDEKKDFNGYADVKDSYTYAPNVEFNAPPGDMFLLQKKAEHTHEISYYNWEWQESNFGGFDIDNGKNMHLDGSFDKYGLRDIWNEYSQNEELYKDRDVSWRVAGVAKVANATHDSKYDDPENPSNAYGRKKIKYELVDDYLYLADDYKKELKPEDYTIKSIEFKDDVMRLYDYKQPDKKSKADYIDAYKNDIIIPASLYIRKTSTSKWEKAASFDMETIYRKGSMYSNLINIKNSKSFIDDVKINYSSISIPEGYTSTKLVYETPFAGISLQYQINGTLHPSKRVKDYIEKSKDGNYVMNIKLRNDSTFLAYDEEGNRLGLQGTTESSTNVDRTLELDRINYGEEMYHSPVHLYLRQKPMPQMHGRQTLNKWVHLSSNNVSGKQFEIPAEVIYTEDVSNYHLYDDEDVRKQYHVQNSGTFYDLLPLGVTGIKDVKISNHKELGISHVDNSYTCYDYYDKNTGLEELNSSYKIIPNWRNSGRSLLIAHFDNAELSKDLKIGDSFYKKSPSASIKLSYTMIYPWDSYKDYGSKIKRNLVAYESGFEKRSGDGLDDSLTNELESGYVDSKPGYKKEYSTTKQYDKKIYTDQEIEWMKDINPDHDEKRFLYAEDSTSVSGDTEANIGLTKHIKDERDSGFKLKTKTREGGHYQYKIRLQAAHATTVSNLIFFDSLENYDPLKADEDYGVKQWRGELESIDVTHPIMKGVDPKIYVSTVPKVDIEKHNDVSDSTVWKPYKEGDDLSKVTGVAVDLRKNKDGSDFKLEQDTAINVYLNMKAPWDMKDKRIDPEAKALNAIFAKHTVSTSLDNKSDKLIYTAYTAIELEPVETEATIKAKKSYFDKEDKNIELKGDDFEFNLKDSEGKILQTKTNDKDGNITFDPIKYHSWDVGEHTYTIEEVKGKDNKIAYDKHIETVKVKVERPGVSEIKASVVYDKDGSNFTNKEKKSASLQLIKLKANEEKFNLEEVKDKDGNLTSYKVPEADLGKTLDGAEYKLYKVNDGKEELVATLTTKNGISNVVEELEAGSYKLVETKAPSGYHLAEDALEFKITDEDAGKLLAKFVTDKGIEDLPSTGGRGTKIFIGTGVTLLGLMAGAMYLANKKKKQATSK